MTYLLDTHTLIWSMNNRYRIPKPTLNIISNPINPVFVSVISFWEISIKYNLGKINLGKIDPQDFPAISRQSGFSHLGISAEDAASYYKLPQTKHRDPFDRMLIWQSIQNNMTLVSKDQAFDQYSNLGLKRIW